MPTLTGPFKWIGGKGRNAKKIAPYIPYANGYIEPFCGAASILFYRKPSTVEAINDLNGDVVNFFQVLQDPRSYRRLRYRLQHTPFARDEFILALEILKDGKDADPVQRAWALFTSQNQGFGGKAKTKGNWGRVVTSKSASSRWNNKKIKLNLWRDRIASVMIENRDALEVIKHWEHKDTIIYCDPPYVHETRVDCNFYTHEMDNGQHQKFLKTVMEANAGIVISGYESDLYKPLTDAGWSIYRIDTICLCAGATRASKLQGDGSRKEKSKRTEVLWLNPRAEELRGKK